MLLCNDTALEAYKKGTLSDYVSVAIEPKDVHRFIEAIEKEEGIEVRGMFNYEKYPIFDLKVYDPATIDFNIRDYWAFGFNNLYVKVEFLQHTPNREFVRKNWRRAESLYKRHIQVNYHGDKIKSRIGHAVHRTVGKYAEKRPLGQQFFDAMIKKYSGQSKYISIGKDVFEKSIFDTKTEVTVEGRKFYIPGIGCEYLEARYEEDLNEVDAREFIQKDFRFRDGDYAWEDYAEYIDYLDFAHYYDNVNTLYEYRSKYRKWNKQFVEDKRLLRRTHLRFVFWQKYTPIKGELIALYEKGDYDSLSEKLQPYLDELKNFHTFDMTIYFDREIFNIAKDILAKSGKTDIAEDIEELIPKEHLAPIRIKDYKGEYI